MSDLLGYLENARESLPGRAAAAAASSNRAQRSEVDFFRGEPLRALSTLVYSDNVDLQRSASLTFAEITERGACFGRDVLEPKRAVADEG